MLKLSHLVDDLESRSSLSIELPVPPSVNSCWRSYRGRVVRSRQYLSWLQEADTIWMVNQARQTKAVKKPIPSPVMILLRVIPGKGWTKARDLDNILKPTQDWLVRMGILEKDSTTVVHCSISCYIEAAPRRSAAIRISLVPLGR